MTILGKDMNDVVGQMGVQPVTIDVASSKCVELLTGPGGKVWVNVDGMCVFRSAHNETVIVDTTHALSTDKVV